MALEKIILNAPVTIGFFLILVISLIASAASSQTTAQSPRAPDAINADLQQAVSQLGDAIQGGRALQSPELRKGAAAQAVPAVDKILALFDEMSTVQPEAKTQIEGAEMQFRVIGAIFDDPLQIAALSKSAAGTDVDAAEAKAALAIAEYVKASDEAGRNKALDAFDVAVRAAPDDMGVLGLLSMTSLGPAPSADMDQHLLNIVKNDAQGQAAQQLVEELEGQIKLKAMENKPLTLEGVSLANPTFSTASWKGKVILVDFWATWCAPCLGELPRVKKTYADYHGNGLEILGVSCDNSADDLKTFLAANPDMPWPQLFDDKTPGWHPLATSYGITSIPTMFLIDRKGVLRTVDARSQMEDLIPKLLAEQP